jgi:hypothetical protein
MRMIEYSKVFYRISIRSTQSDEKDEAIGGYINGL